MSCINSSYLASNSTPISISLPTYSYVDVQVDLRHLNSSSDLQDVILYLQIHNLEKGLNYTEQLSMNVSALAYSLYAGSNIVLSAYYSIT